jgi:hypothetical protein
MCSLTAMTSPAGVRAPSCPSRPLRPRTAKLKAGGGEGVAHSRERPFQGSPVSSRSSSRRRMLTTSCAICRIIPIRMIAAPPAAISSHGCQAGTS